MSSKHILGIDVGTTSVKLGLIDAGGYSISSFTASYPTTRQSGGIVEQNPDNWVELIDKGIQQFVNQGYTDSIAVAGLCSQVNTHVFVDINGKALLPAIQWQDGRASSEAAELDDRVSDEQKLRWWGVPMPIDASNVLSRMLWVSRHRPEVWDKTHRVLLPKDYCILKLTGETCTDPLSNIGLVDRDLNYLPEVFDLIPGSAEKAAPLKALTDSVGKLQKPSALAGLPMVCGTMDAWAGLVGTGAAKEGSSVYLSGTSEILGISSTTVVPTQGAIVFARNDGIVLHAAPTQSGGDAKLWFANMTNMSPEQMSELVADTPASIETPLFLPQLEGERAPLWDADLRASFIGVSRRTGLGDLARAVYEGVAFSARYALEVLQVSAATTSPYLSCGGGGFRSDSWNQIRADVLGVELRTMVTTEPGVLGAATIAAIGVGEYSSFTDAHDALAKHARHYQPAEKENSHYNERFAIYKDAIMANATLTNRLRGLKK